MSKKPENPQAFPVSTVDGFTADGMTLRDYFAAKALQGMTSAASSIDSDFRKLAAGAAYRIADAMLAEREKLTTT